MRKLVKKILLAILILVITSAAFFFFYSNSLRGVNITALRYYERLKTELIEKGFKPRTLVISGRRAEWHNQLLTSFGAAKKSQHLQGNAIDIMVLDVNDDGAVNGLDVDIVTEILEALINDTGGIGTYKTEDLIWNQQMVHFDSRGNRARWKR